MDEDKHVEEEDFKTIFTNLSVTVTFTYVWSKERLSKENLSKEFHARWNVWDDCKLHLNKTKERYTRKWIKKHVRSLRKTRATR